MTQRRNELGSVPLKAASHDCLIRVLISNVYLIFYKQIRPSLIAIQKRISNGSSSDGPCILYRVRNHVYLCPFSHLHRLSFSSPFRNISDELVPYAPKTFPVDGSLGNSRVRLTRIESQHEFRETLRNKRHTVLEIKFTKSPSSLHL